jgi:two-component system CheB/CheR fusion protein
MLKVKANEVGRGVSTSADPVVGLASLMSINDIGFRQMLDALPAAIYTTDANGRITHFNPACVEFSGRTPELGTDHWCVTWKLFHPDGTPMPHDECPMAIALKTGRVIRGAEAIAERPDGTRIWFIPYPTPLFDDSGNVIGGINMLMDITERKQAEAANARLAAIVESSDDAIISKDLNGIIASWNQGAERLFGYTAEEVIGKPVTVLIPPDHVDEEPGILDRLRRGQRIDHYETVRQRKDGVLIDISLTVSPVKDGSGRIIGAAKVARDITQRKQTENAVKIAREQAEAASSAKDRFLAVLSHELRTPLTPVMMAIAAMDMNPDLAPDIRDDIAMIRRNLELEARLIDDLLDLSRVTAGKLRLSKEIVDVNSAVRHVCEICRPFILEKGIHLHCDLPADAYHVKADPTRFQQILWNLLKNAAKFTPDRGDIYVNVSKTDQDRVRIQVRDTGIGIATEILPKIFDAFEQGDANITRQFGGMGLGLAISKALAEMHHGTIRAESGGAGAGSTFTVELPIVSANKDSHAGPTKHAHRNGDALRVLVVEDHAETARLLSKLLGASGHKVKTAGTAAAALELAGKEPFDVIVSDIGLPDATGYDLMKQIRARYPMKGIAMSGYGMDDDLRKSREAGFSDHIVKPANVAQLERTIRRVVGKSE